LWAGTRETFAGLGISLGTLAAFLILLQRVFQPITALGEEWQTVQAALAGAERIFATLAIRPESPPRPKNQRATGDDGPLILLDRVVFGYHPEQPVLHRATLKVEAGQPVQLVGRTGAGKSPALQLLAGFFEPWAGTVRIVGRDPALLGEAERKEILGVVPQVVQLFSGTILDNLTLGDPSISDEAVVEAAGVAGIDAFVRTLPLGYRTWLGHGADGPAAQLSARQQPPPAPAPAVVPR